MAEDVIVGRIAVKVMPDTSDFRDELKRKLDAIEKSLKDIKVGVKLDSGHIAAEAKKVNRELERSLKNHTVRVNMDNESSLRAAVGRVRRQLDDLGATNIELKADEDGLKGQLADFQKRLREVGRLRLRVDPKSETSIQRAINQIEAELAKRRELAVNVRLDKASLERTKQELDRRLRTRIDAQIAIDNATYAQVKAQIKQFTDGIVINPDLDDRTVRAKLREIERTIEALDGKKVELAAAVKDSDKRQIERDIDDLQDKLDSLKGDIQLRVKEKDKFQVATSLAILVRDRVVKIVPELSKTAAANVVTALAAMSGARAIGKIFDDLWGSIKNLDRAAPLIGTVALAVANLGAVGIASASSLASLSASLASIGPAALTLPGILGGLAIGIGVTAVAFSDFSKRIPEVKAALSALKTQMQNKFWSAAEQPIRKLVDSLLPEFSAGINKVAGQLGDFFGNLAGGLGDSLAGELAGMFDDLGKSIDIASTSAGDIANIIKILGETGAGYLPRLAQWFADVTANLSDFLTKAAQGGQNSQLNQWINTAIQALTDLGHVIVAVGGIFAGLGKAATEAGGSVLASMADTLQRVSDVVNSADFQTSLVGVFSAAHTAIDQLTSQSGPALERFFSNFATTLQTILPMAGGAFGKLLGGIADALAQPAFQNGLVDLFTGIGKAVDTLTPALGPLGQALGAIASLLGTFLTALAPNLATVLTGLAHAVDALAPLLEPVVTLLGQGLAAAIQQIVPLFARLAQAITDVSSGGAFTGLVQQAQGLAEAWAPLAPLLGGVLVSAFKALASVSAPLVSTVMQIATALGPLVQQILPTLGPLLESIGTTVGTVVGALGPFVAKVIEIASTIVGPLLAGLIPLVSQHLPQLGEAFARLLQVLQPVLDLLQKVATWIAQYIVPAVTTLVGMLLDNLMIVINGLVDVIAAMVQNIQGIWEVFAGIFTGDWTRVWNGIKTIFSAIWGGIVAILKTLWNVIVNIFGTFGAQAIEKWKSTWETVHATASSVWNWLKSTWSSITGAITGTANVAWDTIKSTFSSLGSSLESTATTAWNAVKSAFTTGVSMAITTVKELPGKAASALGNLGSTLVSAGKTLIKGFIAGIKAMFGSVRSTLADLTSKLTSWKGPPATDARLLTGAGRLVIDGFIDGLESRYDAVRTSLSGLTADISGITVDAPSIRATSSALTASVSHGLDAGAAGGVTQKVLNYYAAPGSSIDSEEDLFAAAGRARMVGW